MLREPKTINVDPDSELGHLLDEATDAPLVLEKSGVRYRVSRQDNDDIWTDYDPERVRKVLAETAGSLSQAEAEAMIADLYRARKEGSRPAKRP